MTRDALQVEAADLGLAVEKISPAIGARIDGLDLREELSEDLVACLMSLLVEYKAIIIRDQDITTEQHVAFSRRFGELEVHPFAAYALKVQNKEGYPEVMRLHFNRDVRAVGAAVWHSDVTWRQEPSLGSVIRSLICPPAEGILYLRIWKRRIKGSMRMSKQRLMILSRSTIGRGFDVA